MYICLGVSGCSGGCAREVFLAFRAHFGPVRASADDTFGLQEELKWWSRAQQGGVYPSYDVCLDVPGAQPAHSTHGAWGLRIVLFLGPMSDGAPNCFF
jgi:hypothetical protein